VIQVVAAVIRREGRVLLCRRTHPEWLAGRWEFPGGKLEEGEDPRAALERELAEELGIRCTVGASLGTHVHHYPGYSLELDAYEVTWTAGELRPTDHDALAWVRPGELDEFELAPADLPIARTLALDSGAAMASSRHAQAQIELHRELAPRYAYRYSFAFSRLFQEDWHAEMISHVPDGARELLDIGCGTGFFLAELEQRHPGSVGLDISYEMLEVSERYVPGAKLVCGDAEKLPFQAGRFDAVFCKGSLHHTRDHQGFLGNCRQVLREGGVLIMSEPCNDNPLIRAARAVMYRRSRHFDEGDQGFTRRGIVALCEEAGFEVTRVKKYGCLAYVFAGFPDHLGILRFIPGSAWITRAFLAIDRVLCALPLFSLLGLHVLLVARPGSQRTP